MLSTPFTNPLHSSIRLPRLIIALILSSAIPGVCQFIPSSICFISPSVTFCCCFHWLIFKKQKFSFILSRPITSNLGEWWWSAHRFIIRRDAWSSLAVLWLPACCFYFVGVVDETTPYTLRGTSADMKKVEVTKLSEATGIVHYRCTWKVKATKRSNPAGHIPHIWHTKHTREGESQEQRGVRAPLRVLSSFLALVPVSTVIAIVIVMPCRYIGVDASARRDGEAGGEDPGEGPQGGGARDGLGCVGGSVRGVPLPRRRGDFTSMSIPFQLVRSCAWFPRMILYFVWI